MALRSMRAPVTCNEQSTHILIFTLAPHVFYVVTLRHASVEYIFQSCYVNIYDYKNGRSV